MSQPSEPRTAFITVSQSNFEAGDQLIFFGSDAKARGLFTVRSSTPVELNVRPASKWRFWWWIVKHPMDYFVRRRNPLEFMKANAQRLRELWRDINTLTHGGSVAPESTEQSPKKEGNQ